MLELTPVFPGDSACQVQSWGPDWVCVLVGKKDSRPLSILAHDSDSDCPIFGPLKKSEYPLFLSYIGTVRCLLAIHILPVFDR